MSQAIWFSFVQSFHNIAFPIWVIQIQMQTSSATYTKCNQSFISSPLYQIMCQCHNYQRIVSSNVNLTTTKKIQF